MIAKNTNGWKMWVINSLFTILLLIVMAGVGFIFAAAEKNSERIEAAVEKATARSNLIEKSYQQNMRTTMLLIAKLDKSGGELAVEVAAIKANQLRMFKKLDDIEERLR